MSQPKEIYRVCTGPNEWKAVEQLTRDDYRDTAALYHHNDVVKELKGMIDDQADWLLNAKAEIKKLNNYIIKEGCCDDR